MKKRPYGNFLIEDKLGFLKFSNSGNEIYSAVECLFSYRLFIKPLLYLYTKMRFKISKDTSRTNISDICMLCLTIILCFILLPIISIELAIYTLFLLLAILIDFIFSYESFCIRYEDLLNCFTNMYISIFFQIVFWNYKLVSNSAPRSINVVSMLIIVSLMLTYSIFYYSFLVTGNDTNRQHYGLILKDLYIIHYCGNYYYSNRVTKTLIKSYDSIIKLMKKDREYFDRLFNLFEKNVCADYGIGESLEPLKIRLLNYAKYDDAFKEYKHALELKTEIICNINDNREIDKIIRRIGIKKTREYLDNLQEYVDNCLNEYHDLYNDMFMKLRIKLL